MFSDGFLRLESFSVSLTLGEGKMNVQILLAAFIWMMERLKGITSALFFSFLIFIYLVMSGLSFGTWDFCGVLQDLSLLS